MLSQKEETVSDVKSNGTNELPAAAPSDRSEEPKDQVGMHERSKGISKQKDYRVIKFFNSDSGRLRQELECLICHKIFSKLCNIKDHLRLHMGIRPYTCSLCGQCFTQKGNRD